MRIVQRNKIPVPPGQITRNISNANNSNIIETIHDTYLEHRDQMAPIAADFRGNTILETCRNIHDWVSNPNNIKYVKDLDPSQDVKSPANFFHSKTGDCKSYSVFVASILYNLGIKPGFTYASYDGTDIPSHVYVSAEAENGETIILDGTISNFNYEHTELNGVPVNIVTYWNNMPVRELINGVPDALYRDVIGINQPINGKLGDWLRRNWQSAKDDVKKYNPLFVLGRNAYLTLVSNNVFAYADRLAAVYGNNMGYKVEEIWEKNFGGDPKALFEAIQKGQPKNPIWAKNKSIGWVYQTETGSINGIGEPITIGAALAAASAIIAVLKPLLDMFSQDPAPGEDDYDPNNDPTIPNGGELPTGNDGDIMKQLGKIAPWALGIFVLYKLAK